MPMCRECGLVAATVEMRRTPKGQALCKDKNGCRVRVADRKLLRDIGRAS